MEFYNEVFESHERLPDQWVSQEFEQCTFKNLDLSQGSLAKSSFINCQFEGCNLTKVDLKQTKFNDTFFLKTKLNYVDFSVCNPFALRIDFQECQLNNTVFINQKLKKTKFVDCSIKEAYFIKCDLTDSLFKQCNLELTKFDDNNLTQVNFSTAYNLRLNLDENKVKKACFSLYNLPGF